MFYLICLIATFILSSAFAAEVGVVRLVGGSYDPSIGGHIYFVAINSTHVWVHADISNITNNLGNPHGIHVHAYGDISSPSASSTGSHFIGVSTRDVHRCENDPDRHEGDMGNWEVSETGTVVEGKTLDLLSLSGNFSIIGRAVVLHNWTDDCNTTSSSGNRLAQGVIGIANIDYIPPDIALIVNASQNSASFGTSTPVPNAVAILTPLGSSGVAGVVTFEEDETGVTVKASISGLNRTNAYGFHIHTYGDLDSPDGLAAGGHYNPFNTTNHGLPLSPTRHVGDLGNICSYGEDGTAYYNYHFSDLVSLSGPNSIIGRTVIIHALWDNGGTRITQGVIGVGNYFTNVTFPENISISSPECSQFAPVPEIGIVHLVGDSLDTGVEGCVYFVRKNESHVYVWANITGITNNPDSLHGLHVHKLGDITGPTALNVGGHYFGVFGEDVHACENTTVRHEGDMGNWQATSGNILQIKEIDLLSLSGQFSIIGRSVVLHNQTDNCMDTSSAGSRLAQGVIGIANPAYLPAEVAALFSYNISASSINNATGGDEVVKGIAVVTPISRSAVYGIVTLEQIGNVVTVKASITGLNSTSAYGFHIHIFGDMSTSNGNSASSHYNPTNQSHHLPDSYDRHTGDLGNICSYGMDGTAYYRYTFSNLLTLSGPGNVVGRSIIIHAIRDDGGSFYGDRIGQGVIGLGSATTNITFPQGFYFNNPSCIGFSTTGSPIFSTTSGSPFRPTQVPSTTTTTGSLPDDKGKETLSGGSKAAIAIIVILLVGGLIGTFLHFQKHKRLFCFKRNRAASGSVDYVAFVDSES